MHTAALIFADIVVIIILARILGRVARAIGQPPVVGEIIAGIALGPSVLGLLPGQLDQRLFPAEVLPYLSILAQLGLVLFMFMVGLELDLLLIRGRGKAAGIISLSAVFAPFVLGVGVALVLYSRHDETPAGVVGKLPLALFLGVAMSITAFPVLSRILTERGLDRTRVGALALACAAVDDIVAWTLLAVVIAVVEGSGPGEVARIIASTVVFALLMLFIGRPALRRLGHWYRRTGHLTADMLAIILVGVLASSIATELIGIHAIFGAFLFGVAMPREDFHDLTRQVVDRLSHVSVLLLLPIFFVSTGLSTDVSSITASGLWQLAFILVAAIGGKIGGDMVSAKALKIPVRESSMLGVLMNTRGLTELVILNVGLQLGVLDHELYTLLVLMAVITTSMTGPLLSLLDRRAAAMSALQTGDHGFRR
jgi:Kef-type K+ transport system membrane component KefB